MNRQIRIVMYAIAVVVLSPKAVSAFYPSPQDWRNENIYQIYTDRFFDGDPSNNYAETNRGFAYAPANSRGIHGGDLRGIQQKLDYVKALGATAIWISPIPLNEVNGDSSGYRAQDFYQLAPHLGTLTDLSNMVTAAHARGIKVILDIVVNHTGNLIYSTDSGYPNFKYPPAGYNMSYINPSNQHAPPFNITNVVPPAFTSLFHTNGDIQNFGDTTQIEKGEISNLDDLNTELTYVRTNLANIYKYWIQTGDLDGFRIDTVPEVDHGNNGFWNYWCPQIHSFATSIGKTNFFMFGEIFDGSDPKVGSYTGTKGSTNFALDATLDYPLYFTINPVFANATANTQQIENHYNAIAGNYDPAAWFRLVTFLDNHDNTRFLSSNNANNNTNHLGLALGFLYTARGIPCLYYGTEQAFNGGGDPNNREDMFSGQFEPGTSVGDNFNETHPLYRYVAMLNNFRRNYPALRLGSHVNQWNSAGGPGLFAYSRVFQTQEVFVVWTPAVVSQTLPARGTTYPAGTQLVNLLNTNEVITIDSSQNTPPITCASFQIKIFVAQSQFQPLDPVVVSQSPAHATTNVSSGAQIVLHFSKKMDTNAVQAAWSLQPPTAGTFTWSPLSDTLTFTAGGSGFPFLTTNSLRIATNAVDAVNGNSFYAPFDTYFVTSAAPLTDTMPPGIALSAPSSGSVITGQVVVSGTATDDTGVAKVEVQLDNGNWTPANGTTAWSFSFNSANFLNGTHMLAARATDTSGNLSTNALTTVAFFNIPGNYVQRISAGNPSNVVDCSANTWKADQSYTFGSFGYISGTNGYIARAISNVCAAEYPLYQRERDSTASSSFSYAFDCPEGVYETTLLEAETFWTNTNQRVFDVFIQGDQVLTDFDIFSAAGGQNIPITLVFTSAVADSHLEIDFLPVADNARASGIQVRKITDLDSDSDGIPDWWMLAYFDHPTSQIADQSCASCNPSGDGLNNLQDFLGGLNPVVSNSMTVAASFIAAPTAGPAALTVNFSDTSAGPITNRFWDFGDGATTNAGAFVKTIAHTYTVPKTNTVTLIVSGLLGDVSTNIQLNAIVVGAPAAPVPPINVTATAVYEDQIWLAWQNAATNQQGFVIQRGLSPTGPWSTINSVGASASNATDCALAGGITYYYQVLATNSFGALPSSVASTMTPATNDVTAFDRASDSAYGGGWTSGGNGAVGFGPWRLVANSGSASLDGFFIGSSTKNGPGGGIGIDSCGESFGLYANSGNNAVAYRTFGGVPLAVGETLRWRQDNGSIGNGSTVGITLRNGNSTNSVNNYNTASRFQFYFLGGTNNYFIIDAAGARDTGVKYTSEALQLDFTLTGTNTYSLQVWRLTNNSITNLSGTLGGTSGSNLDSLAVFNRNAGSGSQYDFLCNYFIRTTPVTADLGLSALAATSSIARVQNLAYMLTVTNLGPANATGVTLTNPLPASVTFVSASPSQGTCTNIGGTVSCNLGALGSSTSAAISIIVTPQAAAVLTNTALISAATTDPVLSNNTATSVTTVIADSVGDGIPDWWRQQYFGSGGTTNNNSCASCDPDGDGLNNLQEFLTDTSPTDPNSAFRITNISIGGDDLTITWTTRPDKTNQLERTAALGANASWSAVGPLTIGTGTPASQSDPGATTNPPAFYRVRLVP